MSKAQWWKTFFAYLIILSLMFAGIGVLVVKAVRFMAVHEYLWKYIWIGLIIFLACLWSYAAAEERRKTYEKEQEEKDEKEI